MLRIAALASSVVASIPTVLPRSRSLAATAFNAQVNTS